MGPRLPIKRWGSRFLNRRNNSILEHISASAGLFSFERRLKTAKHKFQYIFKDILGHDIPDFPRQPYENEF